MWKKSIAGGLVCKLEFSQTDGSGRDKAAVAQRSEFALCSWINRKPVEKCDMRRDDQFGDIL